MPSEDKEPEQTQIILSWADIYSACVCVVGQMNAVQYLPKKLVAISRGGLAPAAILAHILDIRDVTCIRFQSYTHQGRSAILIGTEDLDRLHDGNIVGPDTLVVDDIWDTGNTLRSLYTHSHSKFKACSLYHKPRKERATTPFPQFPGKAVGDRWVVFPWEAPNTPEVFKTHRSY
jgi:xanthine phosphoribosyltransferase